MVLAKMGVTDTRELVRLTLEHFELAPPLAGVTCAGSHDLDVLLESAACVHGDATCLEGGELHAKGAHPR
jgi:hypothetical protein